MKRIIIILVSVIISSNTYAEQKYIGNIFSGKGENRYVIFVDKSLKKVFLVETNGEKQKILKNITSLVGEFEGDKVVEGDKKTPEGVYYIVSYMDNTTMERRYTKPVAARYGTGAYPLNYPNPLDKYQKKTGYGIWLHGLDPERHKPATEGCVAIKNEELDSMKEILYINMPFVIADEGTYYTSEEYCQTREQYLTNLNNFIKVWNYGPYEEFKEFVHPDYSSYAGKNQKEFLTKKKHLMTLYPDKQINIENIQIFTKNDHSVVYDFDQFYCADNLVSYNNKKLYTIDNKIVTEEISSKSTKQYLTPYVLEFIEDWKKSWTNKELDNYLSMYSENMKKDNMEQRKKVIFDAAGDIVINLTDISWEQISGNSIKITFKQKYSSSRNSDLGYKTLIIKGCPGSYKIMSEDWRAI